VNGVETHATLDTSAELSMVGTLLAKSALNIDPGAGDHKQARICNWSYRHTSALYRHTFDSFDFAGVQFSKTHSVSRLTRSTGFA
jgi:hypothetical protein